MFRKVKKRLERIEDRVELIFDYITDLFDEVRDLKRKALVKCEICGDILYHRDTAIVNTTKTSGWDSGERVACVKCARKLQDAREKAEDDVVADIRHLEPCEEVSDV
jgi:hypothetical protein